MKKKARRSILLTLILIPTMIYFFRFQNNAIVTTEIPVTSKKIPQSFNGYKIVHLSDLHNKSFGSNQKELLQKISQEDPNLIVFTGDLVDARRYNEEPSLTLMEELVQLAPVYYVTGNHEWKSKKFNTLERQLKSIGVNVMRNTTEEISNGKDTMLITGVDDPAVSPSYFSTKSTLKRSLSSATEETEESHFRLLLAHRPEWFPLYTQEKFDLVFSGHAHGGQIRMPFIDGIIAPGQGFFPKYTSGSYEAEGTAMVVSRGLGNSGFPFRVFNRPEIVVVTLHSTDS